MPTHIEVGRRGEDLARTYLEQHGYQILQTNWRFRRAEVDLIALDPREVLVFVEVKTRSDERFGPPETAVGDKKRQFLLAAARAFMVAYEYDWEVRFDVIGVVLTEPPTVRHWTDVFYR